VSSSSDDEHEKLIAREMERARRKQRATSRKSMKSTWPKKATKPKKSKKVKKSKRRRRARSCSSTDSSSDSDSSDDEDAPAKKLRKRMQFKHAVRVGAIGPNGTLNVRNAMVALHASGLPARFIKLMKKGRWNFPFNGVNKEESRGYKTTEERAARVVHSGTMVGSQSRAMLPFTRWLKVFKRFQYTYLELNGQSDYAHMDMQRYEAQLLAVHERYAHHPARDLCVAMVDHVYRDRATNLCGKSGAPDSHSHVRPDWDIGAELFTEVLGQAVATCARCGQSGHPEWACGVGYGAQVPPQMGWPPMPPTQAPPQQLALPMPQQPPQLPPAGGPKSCGAFNRDNKGCTYQKRTGRPCTFSHVCTKCGATDHGARSCSKK
jgi:hypothetical protein